MSFSAEIRRRRLLPWAAPVVAVAVVAAVSLAPRAFAGDSHPSLPTRSTQDLIALVSGSSVRAFSGTVQSTPNLGLPQLPGGDGGNLLSTLLTNPTSLRVSVDGPTKTRVALSDNGKEMDVIRNGADIWTWDSSTQSVTHYTGKSETEAPATSADEPTPQAEAQKLLAAITPSTGVAVGPTASIAGRSAYTLQLTPKTTDTLIGRADIWIDSASGLPLGFALYPQGSGAAALTEKFSSISLETPAARTFTFTAPKGVKVNTPDSSSGSATSGSGSASGTATKTKPSTTGDGWSTIGIYPISATTNDPVLGSILPGGTSGNEPSRTRSLFDAATTAGPNGSRELQTRLLNVLITSGGTVVAGAVPLKALESAAANLP